MGSGTKPRRTQAERRAETRARLLDATIESLIEDGYAGHHDPPRHRAGGRLAGSAEPPLSAPGRPGRERVRAPRRAADRPLRRAGRSLSGDRSVRLRALLDLLWEDFSSPLFTVAAKLWVASADDPELRERLIPVEKRIYAATAEVAPRGRW